MTGDDETETHAASGKTSPKPAPSLPAAPYATPDQLEERLAEVLAYWEGLKRRQNSIPFWDDMTLTELRGLSDGLMTIDVFERPERFRFGVVGQAIAKRYGDSVESRFIDELARRAPFEYLLSHCSATVQAGAPTFYHHVATNVHTPDPSKSYLRMLLPLWGEGHIAMLLGAVVLAE